MHPDVALTTAEVSALLDLPEKKVRKEIEHHVFEVPSPPRLALDAVVYLKALTELDALNPSVEGRRRFFMRIREALASKSPPADELALAESGDAFTFKLKEVVEAVWERIEAFERWKTERVATNPNILAGEPAFRGSRLSVRHIGQLAARTSIADIMKDYDYLSSGDVMFAARYARAYPRVGRPREST